MNRSQIADRSTDLTPREKLRAAVAVLCEGVPQHVVAALYGVNPGRIGEIMKPIRKAIGAEKNDLPLLR